MGNEEAEDVWGKGAACMQGYEKDGNGTIDVV